MVRAQRVSDAFAFVGCGALVAFYAFRQGGYFPDTPGLVAAGLLLALALRAAAAERVATTDRRALLLTGGALAAFGAWTMLSALWSHAPWRAAVEADRILGYLAVLVLFATLRRGPRSGEWLVRGLAAGAVVVCTAALATRLAPDAFPTPPDVYPGRLGWPLTYWNALGLLAAIGALSCVHVSATAGRACTRALASAAVPVLAATLLLTFSRASLALCIAAVVAYALLAWSPGTLAALLAAAVPVAVTAVATLQADALAGDDPAGAAGRAQGHRLAFVVLGAVAAAAVARLAVERLPLERLRVGTPRARRAAVAVLAVLLVLAPAGLIAAAARERGTATADARGHLLSASSSGRRAYWDAALGAFGHRPVNGTGAGTYELWWDAHRPHPTVVVQAHSLPLETAAELGIVGLALLVTALGGAAAALGRLAGSRDPAWIALLVAAGAWLVHAAVDWDWQMPGVTVWLFAAVGLAVAPGAAATATRRVAAPARALAGLVLLAAAALPALVALSQVQLRDAADALGSRDCARATDAARLSKTAVPFRAEPEAVLAWCDAANGRAAAAVRHADRAARLDPNDWEEAYADALVRAAAGRAAAAPLRRAAALDPLEKHIRLAHGAVAAPTPARRRRRAESLPLVLGGVEYPSVSEL